MASQSSTRQLGRNRRAWLWVAICLIVAGLSVLVAVGLRQSPAPGIVSGCPASQASIESDQLPPMPGGGPVYPLWAGLDGAAYYVGTSIDVTWVARADYSDRTLVSGRRLDGPGRLGFGDSRYPMVALELQPNAPGSLIVAGWQSLSSQPIVVSDAGCYELTIAARSTTETIVFEARPSAEATRLLRSRRLVPARNGPADCAASASKVSTDFLGPVLGEGPVYLGGLGQSGIQVGWTSSGAALPGRAFWVASPRDLGPLLLREADGGHALRFADRQRDQLLPIHSYVTSPGQPLGWRQFVSAIYFTAPGCMTIQIDGLTTRTLITLLVEH